MHIYTYKQSASGKVYIASLVVWYLNALISVTLIPNIRQLYKALGKQCLLDKQCIPIVALSIMFLVSLVNHMHSSVANTTILRILLICAGVLTVIGIATMLWILSFLNVLILP